MSSRSSLQWGIEKGCVVRAFRAWLVSKIESFAAEFLPEQIAGTGQRGNEDDPANDQTFSSEVFRRWFRSIHHLFLPVQCVHTLPPLHFFKRSCKKEKRLPLIAKCLVCWRARRDEPSGARIRNLKISTCVHVRSFIIVGLEPLTRPVHARMPTRKVTGGRLPSLTCHRCDYRNVS